MPSPLSEAHIEAERRLRLVTTTGVERIWRTLPSYDRKDVPKWLSAVVPLVTAAQRQSVALTEAYLARALERQPLGVDPDAIIRAARNGTPPEVVYERSFIAVWSALADGLLYADAVAQGEARAVTAARTDVQLAMRDTLIAVANG